MGRSRGDGDSLAALPPTRATYHIPPPESRTLSSLLPNCMWLLACCSLAHGHSLFHQAMSWSPTRSFASGFGTTMAEAKGASTRRQPNQSKHFFCRPFIATPIWKRLSKRPPTSLPSSRPLGNGRQSGVWPSTSRRLALDFPDRAVFVAILSPVGPYNRYEGLLPLQCIKDGQGSPADVDMGKTPWHSESCIR